MPIKNAEEHQNVQKEESFQLSKKESTFEFFKAYLENNNNNECPTCGLAFSKKNPQKQCGTCNRQICEGLYL